MGGVRDADVGITEFLSFHKPFRAVVKQRVDDFVVNEVRLDNTVARLTSLAAPPPAAPQVREESSVSAHLAEATIAAPVNLDSAYASLDELIGVGTESVSDAMRAFVANDGKELVLPVVTEKATRTALHAWVREHLPAYVTDTIQVPKDADVPAGQAVRLRPRVACRPWKRRREGQESIDANRRNTYDPREYHSNKKQRSMRDGREEWYVGPKTFVSFVLWKKNRDTLDSLSCIAKQLRIRPDALTHAGTKDKRAVTTQMIHVRGVSLSRLANANRMLAKHERGSQSIAIGNVEVLKASSPESKALTLGDLRGNRFTLALRDLEIEDNENGERNVLGAVENLRTRGFINYFGLQRFGSGESPTHETGFAVLRGDFQEACRLVLLPLKIEEGMGRTGEGIRPDRQRLMSSLQGFADGTVSAKDLLGDLPRWMNIERSIVSSFAHDEERGHKKYDYRAAFSKLQRNMRKMYGHAVQSYLWNMMASARARAIGGESSDAQLYALCGDLVPVAETDNRELTYQTKVRAVSQAEEDNKSIPLERVLIPVIGSDVSPPETALGAVVQSVLVEHKIDMKRLPTDYAMKGTYRWLLAKPKDLDARIVRYSIRGDNLIPSDVDALLRTPRRNDRNVRMKDEDGKGTLHNDCNTMPVRNETAGTGLARADVITDKTKDNKTGTMVQDCVEKTFVAENKEDTSEMEEVREQEKQTTGQRRALIISFTLGCAEYATMLVRAITRQDSGVANQKAMQDEGDKANDIKEAAISEAMRVEVDELKNIKEACA